MSHPYRLAANRLWLGLRRSFNVLWLVLLAGYFSVLTGQSVLRNYHSQQQTGDLKQRLAQDLLEKERLQELLVYYQSDNFKEKELRQSLLLKRPSEHMYALPESSIAQAAENNSLQQAAAKQADLGPIWHQWVEYLLGNSSS